MQLFLRIIKTAWQGFWRNGWLSLVAIFIMVQVLLLVGIFVTVNVAVNNTIQMINDRIDVAIFFKDYVNETDITVFQGQLQNISGIKEVKFISQQQALESYLASNRHNQDLIAAIGNDASFFPASLEIKVTDPDLIETIVQQVKDQDQGKIIAQTSWERNQDLVGKLRRLNRLIAWGDLGVSLVMLLVALLIIFNTIRITIFTRKEEIEIMKLVGATDWYIRWPFILEGVLYGFAGAVLAFGLIWVVVQGIIWLLGGDYLSWQIMGDTAGSFDYIFALRLFSFQVFFGVLVGAISSYLSTKRYLRI